MAYKYFLSAALNGYAMVSSTPKNGVITVHSKILTIEEYSERFQDEAI